MKEVNHLKALIRSNVSDEVEERKGRRGERGICENEVVWDARDWIGFGVVFVQALFGTIMA
jgi:hypothetical protein